MGKHNGLDTEVFIKAKSILKAMAKAKQLPAVKHSKLPPKIVEITEEEYSKGVKNSRYYENMDQLITK